MPIDERRDKKPRSVQENRSQECQKHITIRRAVMQYTQAQKEHVFILTAKGVTAIKERVRCGAEAGMPIRGRESSVPKSWANRGYVVEVRI